jgi:UDP-N-acetyl-D-mannosaminuronic acid dehydrogenase
LAYKPNVDDLRESPAVEVVHSLLAAGAQVRAFEPYKTTYALDGVSSTATLREAVQDAELILLLVGHDEFKALDPAEMAAMSSARLALDTVNAWNVPDWYRAGFTVHRLGRGTPA